jgi:hypothetical protein
MLRPREVNTKKRAAMHHAGMTQRVPAASFRPSSVSAVIIKTTHDSI